MLLTSGAKSVKLYLTPKQNAAPQKAVGRRFNRWFITDADEKPHPKPKTKH